MVNKWAIVNDCGTHFIGSEEEIKRVWQKIGDGAIRMPGNPLLNNYQLLVEIHETRR